MRVERDQIRALALVVLLTAGFAAALWLPHHMAGQKLQHRIARAKGQLESERPAAANLTVLSQQVAQLQQTLDHSRKQIPQDDDLADLLRQLSGELQARQTTDQEIQTQAVVTGADYCVVPVSLSFKGSCPAVFEFLQKVESGQRLVRVTRLEMHRDLSKPAEPLKVNVDLCTYFSPAEARTR